MFILSLCHLITFSANVMCVLHEKTQKVCEVGEELLCSCAAVNTSYIVADLFQCESAVRGWSATMGRVC